jgi:hypothetical protein
MPCLRLVPHESDKPPNCGVFILEHPHEFYPDPSIGIGYRPKNHPRKLYFRLAPSDQGNAKTRDDERHN